MACNCSVTKASGDPAGMSIAGLGKARISKAERRRRSGRATKRKHGIGRKRKSTKSSSSSGAFCVLTSTGKKFSCNFKSAAAARKMTKGKSGWKVVANKGGRKKARKR